jgi:threonyl-tRNA synthetase
MPERFSLEYTTPAGTPATPVMLHRAVLGSLERFIALLIEHTGGDLPAWLAPVQVRILTLTERQEAYGREIRDKLHQAGWRVELDDRNEKLGYKIREAQLLKIPYVLVVGDREAAEGKVAPRTRRQGAEPAVSLESFIERLRQEAAPPVPL